MNNINLEKKLKKIFAEVFDLPESELSEKIEKKDFEKWDSLGHLQLIMTLENEFDFRIKAEKIPDLVSFSLILKEIYDHQR